jgi:hypothetical protein
MYAKRYVSSRAIYNDDSLLVQRVCNFQGALSLSETCLSCVHVCLYACTCKFSGVLFFSDVSRACAICMYVCTHACMRVRMKLNALYF